jgi:hypothetical protein
MTECRAALTAAQCRQFADEHKARARKPGLSSKRTSLLTNIAHSFSGLASQLEMLDADMAQKSRQSADLNQWSASVPVTPSKHGASGRKTAPG